MTDHLGERPPHQVVQVPPPPPPTMEAAGSPEPEAEEAEPAEPAAASAFPQPDPVEEPAAARDVEHPAARTPGAALLEQLGPIVADLRGRLPAVSGQTLTELVEVMAAKVAPVVNGGRGGASLAAAVGSLATLTEPALRPVSASMRTWWRANGPAVEVRMQEGMEIAVQLGAMASTWVQGSRPERATAEWKPAPPPVVTPAKAAGGRPSAQASASAALDGTEASAAGPSAEPGKSVATLDKPAAQEPPGFWRRIGNFLSGKG